MTRGGATKTPGDNGLGPERRCIATGASGPTDRLIRFVLGPSGEVVPDLGAKLPGRGVWLTAEADLVETAVRKNLFSRAFRAHAKVPGDLAQRLEHLIARRLIDLIGLARKAGQAVTGFEKVRARLKDGAAGVLLEARDGAEDGREKLSRLAKASAAEVPIVDLLDSAELGLAFGRDFAIHAALDRGGFADRVIREAERLAGLRVHRPRDDDADTQVPGGVARPVSNVVDREPGAAPGQGD